MIGKRKFDAILFTLALIALSLTSCSSDESACSAPTVDTVYGPVCGIRTTGGYPGEAQNSLYAYLGIPYAGTTAGSCRWTPPQPAPAWSETLEAVTFGPGCPQDSSSIFDNEAGPISEDCLSVNVWTPDPNGKRAVMVFIYGGAFLTGASGGALYNGANLAGGGDLVVVTLNYRLGALGFLAGVDGLEGNYGIMDQQAALQWVQDNISRFGGDPERVTLFGESAGAMSVGIHLTIPSSQGYFRSAIMESNPYGLAFKGMGISTRFGNHLKEMVECSGQGLECMRSVPVETILEAQDDMFIEELLCSGLEGFLTWTPAIDGNLIQRQPNQVPITKPIMLGTNKSEAELFVSTFVEAGERLPHWEYIAALAFTLGPIDAARVLPSYHRKLLQIGTTKALAQILTDYLFTCANQHVANLAQDSVYAYQFTYSPSFPFWYDLPECDPSSLTSCHAEELPFVFGNAKRSSVGGGDVQFTPEEEALSTSIMRAWTAFAKSGGNPNVEGYPSWEPYSRWHPYYQILDETISNKSNLGAYCGGLWDWIGYQRKSVLRGCFQSD